MELLKRRLIFVMLLVFCNSFTGCADHKLTNLEEVDDYKLAVAVRAGSLVLSESKRNEARKELERRHPNWAWDSIDEQSIVVGMTQNEVIASWRRPDKINRSSYGDQWIYKRSKWGRQYLYFKNDRLVAWQDRL